MTPSRTKNKTCKRADELKLSQRPSCTELKFNGGSDKSTRHQLRHQATSRSCGHLSYAVLSMNRTSRQGTLLCAKFSFMAAQIGLREDDVVTSFGVTDAPLDTAVATNGRSPYNATASGVTDEQQRQHTFGNITASKKQPLTLGAWNVRTTNDSDSSIRPECATAIICRELENANNDICAVSEVRRTGSGNIIERSHTIFWSGNEEKTAGVCFAISNKLAAQGINPVPINDRLMTVQIQLRKGERLTLISVYTPTIQRTQEEKENFYEKLGNCVAATKDDFVIILGDLNARVGKDWKAWPKVIGKHGVGNMNSNGLMLLEFCTRFEISVMGTMFQQKDSLKNTWQHLRSKHWHQLDHVLSNQAAKQHIKVTKVNQAADCFTDHKLLVAKCLFSVKPEKKGTKPPKKLDVNMNDDKKEKLEQFLNENLPAGKVDFEDLKQVLQNAATYVFGKKKRVQNDWFDDQEIEIRSLLKDKKHNRNTLRKRIRELKNNWFQQKAEEAERFSQETKP